MGQMMLSWQRNRHTHLNSSP